MICLVPVPKQHSVVMSTGDATSRSSIPPPRPTAMPRTKSDYAVRASDQGLTVVRNQSDTKLDMKSDDVSSPPKSVDQSLEPVQKPAADNSGVIDMSSANHLREDPAGDSVDVEDADTTAMPPPTSLPPALPPGFANRGPPPPLPASRPVGVLPSANPAGVPAGNQPAVSAPMPAPRPDAAAGKLSASMPAGNTQVPVPAPRPDAAVGVSRTGNSASPPVPARRPDAAAAVSVPQRDIPVDSANHASPVPKTATDEETETPYIPPRPKAIASAQPVMTTTTTGTPIVPARTAPPVPPPVPSRSSIPPPTIPPRQTNNS